MNDTIGAFQADAGSQQTTGVRPGSGRFDHIYVMGAGRSGTTLLSIMLGAHPATGVRGELLQFAEYWRRNLECSCGKPVRECGHWLEAGRALAGADAASAASYDRLIAESERHWRVAQYLLAPRTAARRYFEALRRLFLALSPSGMVIDASKYVARALVLDTIPDFRVGYVYIVRDARGVLHSFSKPVQRPKSAMAAALYYVLVNGAAQLAVWTRLRGRSIKVRYEDLVAEPGRELERIGRFLGLDMSGVIASIAAGEPLDIGHMVSGNRIRTNGVIKVGLDDEWRGLSAVRRVGYYLACLPLQIVNRYRL
ncbi:MAG: sulfotransferase [Steroidobacteraceae bacterium]